MCAESRCRTSPTQQKAHRPASYCIVREDADTEIRTISFACSTATVGLGADGFAVHREQAMIASVLVFQQLESCAVASSYLDLIMRTQCFKINEPGIAKKVTTGSSSSGASRSPFSSSILIA